MAKIPNVLVLGPDYYAEWLGVVNMVNKVEEADLVFFTGGHDVGPELYEEKPHPSVYANEKRDDVEIDVYVEAVQFGVPMLGVCRGSQFLTVMNRGKLVQHCIGHTVSHYLRDYSGYSKSRMLTTSTHHQMMYPFNLSRDKYMVLAATESRLAWLYHKNDIELYSEEEVLCEPEIVFYPETRSLAIQGHPEMMDKTDDMVVYCKHLLNKFLFSEQWRDQNISSPF